MSMRSAQVLVSYSGMIFRYLLPEKLKNFRIEKPGNGRRRGKPGPHENITPGHGNGNGPACKKHWVNRGMNE
jgi:hypothetical protein